MSMSVDRELARAYALGVRNREILELLAQHCRHAEVEYAGGHGMAEAASGLPIDMRTIRCQFAKNQVGSAMNMEWIAVDFYRANCVGCPDRQPVGVPNLATFVGGLDEVAARGAEEQARRADAVERRRGERAQRRSSMATGEPLGAANVLDDMDLVDDAADIEPGAEADRRDSARRRIVETARRAPETFTPAVVEQLRELAGEPRHAWVFEVLRHLARAGHADAQATIVLALEGLRVGRSPEASHVLVDLRDAVTEEDLSPAVMRSLVHLAGTPELHGLTGAFSRGRVRDQAGLVMAIDVSLPTTLSTLAGMLRSVASDAATPPPTLWLPPGVGRRVEASPAELDRDADRAAAAVAARTVLTAVPDSAGVLGPQLLDALQIQDADDYISASGEVVETLAGLLLEQPDVVVPLITLAGTSCSEELRTRLFDIAERATWNLHRWRQRSTGDDDEGPESADYAGDFPHHRLGTVELGSVLPRLFDFALERLGGDWGGHVAGEAGRMVHTLVSDHVAELNVGGRAVDAVIGHLIGTAEDPRTGSGLVPPSPLAALEQMSRDQARYSILRELRKALRALAAKDPGLVLGRIEPLLDADLPQAAAGNGGTDGIGAESSAPRAMSPEEKAALDLREELVSLLGELARDHALVPGVLRRVLPRLTTHMLGEHPPLRAAAIQAWAEAAHGDQPLPTTLLDCLPVLLTDTYFVVIGALLDVLPSLLSRSADMADGLVVLVLQWVFAVEPAIRSQRAHREPDVVWVLRAAAHRFEDHVETQLLASALALGEHLSAYELRHHLEGRWPSAISTSAQFAQLYLRALCSPEIDDDRDELITALLNSWPGTAALTDEELAGMASQVRPEYPLMGGDHLELLGRMGRYVAAAMQAERLLGAVPNAPAADTARAIASAMHAATKLEVAVTSLATDGEPSSPGGFTEIASALDAVDAAVLSLTTELDREDPRRAAFGLPSRPGGRASRMLDALSARAAGIRAVLPLVEGPLTTDEADSAAEMCEAAADALRRAYPAALPTAAAYEHYGNALDVIACYARADAATRRADSELAAAQLDAAHRRAKVLAEELTAMEVAGAETATGDPLTRGLSDMADRARNAGIDVAAILARELLSVSLPLRTIEGPRHQGPGMRTTSETTEEPEPEPVVVCLLSLDDHPLTEHAQVLHRDQVYTLTVNARGAGWPAWADRLELEPVSALTEVELTLPAFEVNRPSGLAEDGDYQFTESGALVVRFALAPGRPAAPVRLSGRFSGPSDNPEDLRGRRRAAVDVAGHPQVRLRPFDPTRDGLTDYPQVDERLLELFARLHGKFPDDQLETFARFLTAIVLAGERIQFDKAYKLGTRVREATFHGDLEGRLRDDPSLGGRLTRGDARALGFLDLDHDGITAELKVERTTPVTEENCHKYLGQPAQYATGANRRLSILVVLDMSRKEAPPGALENYLWLMQPAAHGLTDPAYPAVVAVVVINANNGVPSRWSRRRIDAAPVVPPPDPSDLEEPSDPKPEGSSP